MHANITSLCFCFYLKIFLFLFLDCKVTMLDCNVEFVQYIKDTKQYKKCI